MTMTGQVITYVIEQTFVSGILFLLVASDGTGVSYWKNLGNYPVGWILVQAEFAIRCTVQALTCTETRQELINLLNGIKQIGCFLKQQLAAFKHLASYKNAKEICAICYTAQEYGS